jgi:UDP-galactopyranose mutase
MSAQRVDENLPLVRQEQRNSNNGIKKSTDIATTGSILAVDSPNESLANRTTTKPDLLVFSHLRWHFVTQRPQHLLTRASQTRQVYFWEEPWIHSSATDALYPPKGGELEFLSAVENPNVKIVRPHFREAEEVIEGQRSLVSQFLISRNIEAFDCWYYTPMALNFSAHLRSEITVYDCMDELSAFLGASKQLVEKEKELFRIADVVFTGGQSIYEAKRSQHLNMHAFPSSIDISHFAQARTIGSEPNDQRAIPHPRAGFFGVLDERLDLNLVTQLAALRPNVHFVFLGPVVKIDSSSLPKAMNVHYLGLKSYDELPSYLAGWDVALMPFALNDATRFISPTKTPEYLAAGKRVVSTSIRDVVSAYGKPGLVDIATNVLDFATAIDRALTAPEDPDWGDRVTRKLADSSWDRTWAAMSALIETARARRIAEPISKCAKSFPKQLRHSSLSDYDYIVVGAGFAGSVTAERLASQLGKRVLVIDKRSHIAGNAYDHENEHGVLIHRYGPHIFHTSSQKVIEYLSQFTEWRPYEHRVVAHVDGKLLPIPINLDTINRLYDLELDSSGMEKFLAERIMTPYEIRSSEDIVVSRVGWELYEKFFRNYTRKHWGLDPSELDASVTGRIPVRYDRDDRYFSDSFQAMPLEGYTRMFERILSHTNISVMLSTDYRDFVGRYPRAKIIYTGPIDEFFDYRFGPLPYRSLNFKHETYDQDRFQPAAVVNYPNDHDYTRITEFKYLTGQQHNKTSIVYEYPSNEGEPYYPIPRPANADLYERYRALATASCGVYFCGRLANYRYLNMDQVVAQALHLYRNISEDESLVAQTVPAAIPALKVVTHSISPTRQDVASVSVEVP